MNPDSEKEIYKIEIYRKKQRHTNVRAGAGAMLLHWEKSNKYLG